MSVQDYAKKMVEKGKKELKKAIMKKLMPILIKYVLPVVAVIAVVVVIIVVIAGAVAGDSSGGGLGGSGGGYFASGSNSVFFDDSISREEFIKMVSEYSVPHVKHGETQQYKDECYKKGFIDYAGDYYDISVQYGFDPRVTFCTGIQESDFGTSRIANDKCNYWGIGAVDGNAYNAAYTYSSIPEGIKALCELWKKYTTPGSTHYNMIIERGGNPTTIEGFNKIYATDTTWADQKINHMKNIFGYVPNTIDTSSFLSTAQGVWQQVCNRFTTYGSTSIIPTGKTIDCSAFVDWVLVEYGYPEFEGTQTRTEQFYNTNWNHEFGWTEIPVAAGENVINKIQPGDLLVRYNGTVHHITIIVKVENNTVYVYDCGSTSHWVGKNGQPSTYTSFITSSPAPGKIIRVTKRQ